MARGKRKADVPGRNKKAVLAVVLSSAVMVSGGYAAYAYDFSESEKPTQKIEIPQEEPQVTLPEITFPQLPTAKADPEKKKEKPKKKKVKVDPYRDEKALLAKLTQKGYSDVQDYDLFKRLSFKAGTFNVLGYTHTTGKDARKGFAGAEKRLPRAVRYIREHNLSIVGLQEFQHQQARQFENIAPEYAVYPGLAGGYRVQNSIAWRTKTWELLEAKTIAIPYFGGKNFDMPYVKLKNIDTGKTLWVANFHNPADTNGNAQKYRNEARLRQGNLANELAQDKTPVLFTGDFNEGSSFTCPFSQNTGFMSAEGTGWQSDQCIEGPKAQRIDWLLYKNLIASDYVFDADPQATKTSDHPIVTSAFGVDPVFDLASCKEIQIENEVKRMCLPYGKQ